MTLEELRASAPRTFDKTLLDLLVAIQQGHAPIVTAEPPPPPRDVAPALVKIADEIERDRERLRKVERALALLVNAAAEDA